MNLGKIEEISAFVVKVKAVLIDIKALSLGTVNPVMKRDELI